jgi:hypothetical protein
VKRLGLQPGERPQVFPVALQVRAVGVGGPVHGASWYKSGRRSDVVRPGAVFFKKQPVAGMSARAAAAPPSGAG